MTEIVKQNREWKKDNNKKITCNTEDWKREQTKEQRIEYRMKERIEWSKRIECKIEQGMKSIEHRIR